MDVHYERYKVYPIGKIENEHNKVKIILDSGYKEGLTGLSGYSHVQVLWWMDKCDNPDDLGTLVEKKPYVNGPERIGVFALRSPERPNPIAVSILIGFRSLIFRRNENGAS